MASGPSPAADPIAEAPEAAASDRCCAFCLVPLAPGGLKRCGGCLTRVYCSPACQKADWPLHHKHWCKLLCGEEGVDWKVAAIPGKGLGLVALRPLPALFRIAVERGYTDPRGHPRIADLMPEGGSLEEKFGLNKLGTCAPGEGDSAPIICLRLSRVNHACDGRCNASHTFDGTFGAGAVVLLAERDIEAGEEITFSYLPGVKAPGRILREKWGIACGPGCSCTDPVYQELVERAARLDGQILSFSRASDTARALSAAKQLIAIEGGGLLRIPTNRRVRARFDAFQMAISRRATLGQAGRFIAEAHELASRAYGPDSEQAKQSEAYVNNPKTHLCYLYLG